MTTDMHDPFAMLDDVPADLRHGFEIGLIYGDLLAGGKGPWIVRDGHRDIYEKVMKNFGLKIVFEPYDDQENTPWPMMVITAERVGLRLV